MKMEAKIRFFSKMVDLGRITIDDLPVKYKDAVIEYRAQNQPQNEEGGQN